MTRPDWQLPAGVSRSLWEFAQDPGIPRDEDRHLAGSPFLELDRQVLTRWLPVPGTVADLGCGTGRLLNELALRGWKGVGVDLSQESLKIARERAGAAGLSMPLLRGNLCTLDFLAEGAFDAAILMFGTLGMVCGAENRLAVIRHARRVLRPEGRLVLHVHSVWRHLFFPQGLRWLLRDLWRRFTANPAAGDTSHDYRGIPNMSHHAFTLAEVRALLEQGGFEIREVIPIDPDAPDGSSQTSRRAFSGARATGWLVLAEAARAR